MLPLYSLTDFNPQGITTFAAPGRLGGLAARMQWPVRMAKAEDPRSRQPERPWGAAILGLSFVVPFFFLTYRFANWVASRRPEVPSIVFGWEHHIPFVSWTIVPYLSVIFLYPLSLFLCRDRNELGVQLKRLLSAQVISVVCFVLFPLRFSFAQPETSGLFGWLFHALRMFDKPFNQAPSLHLSVITIVWAKFSEHVRGGKLLLLRLWLALAGVSTLTTYQHHVFDLLPGICVGLACIAVFPAEQETREDMRRSPEAWKIRNPKPGTVHATWLLMLVFALTMRAQDAGESELLPPPSVAEKWDLFKAETAAPFTLGAGAFNAAVSQVTHSTPLYGRHPWPAAYPERLGASVGDIVSQNFFGDFLLASALHEDTRYRRLGSSHRLWRRAGYAITRSVVTQTDSGGATFNWANVLGTGTSAALSNAYYPPGSRNARAATTNWGVSMVGSGLVNLVPEFWPDVSRRLKRLIFASAHQETPSRRHSL
jgi:hypothetical protein